MAARKNTAVETKDKPAKSQIRKLVILLDGTWQTDRGDTPPTNIVRLRDLIVPKHEAEDRLISQQIYYDPGVGTDGSTFKKIWDGISGGGLEQTVRAAYRFLSLVFKPGDEIFVFGFSRGAFSARSLVGYVHAAGLLKPELCSEENEERAWRFYRTPRRGRFPAEKVSLRALCWPEADVRVKCLGVFDTVGTRGIPGGIFRSINAKRYGFHDTNLSSIVDYAFHALAADEQRKHYSATLWSYSFHTNNKRIEQVWFPGAHSDVGGGVIEDKLSNIPLNWLVSRIEDLGLDLIFNEEARKRLRQESDPTAEFLGNKGRLYRWLARNPRIRVISQTPPRDPRRKFSSLPRYAKPVNEAIHWSVFLRMQEHDTYKPDSIDESVLKTIYIDGTAHDTDTVGKQERFLLWWENEQDYEEIQHLLPDSALAEFIEKAEKPPGLAKKKP